MTEESEHTQTVVDGDEHHVLGTPLLTVELRLGAEALTEAATMDPQGYGEFLIHLARGLGPYVQIETVLTEGSLLAITPLSVVATSVLDGLIAGTAEGVADLNTLPGHDGLRLTPTVLLDGRCGVGDTTIDKHIGMVVGQDTLYLTTLNR